MNNLFKVNLCIILFLCLNDLSAQTNFRPGFVITNENDTLRGLINYKGDGGIEQKCDFKKSEGSEVKVFYPSDIKEFSFKDGNYYVSKKIKSNGAQNQLFLENLVHGMADLYCYKDGANPHYFIEKSNGQWFELTNAQSYAYTDGKEHVYGVNMYVGVLRYAFSDCPKIFGTIDVTSLDDYSMINVIKKYNDYVGGVEKSIVYKKQGPSVIVKFAPFVSINPSSLKFNDTYSYQVIHNKIANSPSFGLMVNTTFPRINKQLSLQVSGEYGKSNFYGTGISPANQGPEETSIDLTSIKGRAGIKYTYPKGIIRPSLMLGGNILWNTNKEGSIIDHAQNPMYVLQYQNYMIADAPMEGFSADLGFDYHISPSIVPFLDLGIERSRNFQLINAVSVYAQGRFVTIINTFHITAGIYF
jgi:hypothetical protein